MAKVTVELNDRLLNTAASLFKGKTKSELITIALVDLVDKYEQKNLYDLFYGDEILIAEVYDYKIKRGSSLSRKGDGSDKGEDIISENLDDLDESGVILDISEDSLINSGVGASDSGAGFDDSGAGFDNGVTDFDDFNDSGAGFNDSGTGFDDSGAGFDNGVTDFDDFNDSGGSLNDIS